MRVRRFRLSPVHRPFSSICQVKLGAARQPDGDRSTEVHHLHGLELLGQMITSKGRLFVSSSLQKIAPVKPLLLEIDFHTTVLLFMSEKVFKPELYS